jgi:UDP-glucuronate 4-epimerase
MNILITGAAGFIGNALIKSLKIDKSNFIIGIDSINDYYDLGLKLDRLSSNGINFNFSKTDQTITSENYIFKKINLEDKESVLSLFREFKIDCVVHLAAQAGVRYSLIAPDSYVSSNLVGFVNIFEACKSFSVKKVLFASSSSVYGSNKKEPFSTNDFSDTPISLYAATKKANEVIAHSYSHLYSIEAIGLRFFTVYGPWGRPDMAPFIFTDKIIKQEEISVYNYGKMKRDFTYIDDVVKVIMKIIFSPFVPNLSSNNKLFNIYNVGSNNPIKLMDFISELELAIGKKAILQLKEIMPGDVVNTYADISQLINDYNISPNTPFNDGIKNLVNWYKSYYNLV